MIRFHIQSAPGGRWNLMDIWAIWENGSPCAMAPDGEEAEARAAGDGECLYLAVRMKEELGPAQGDHWMRLAFTLEGGGALWAVGLGGYGEETGLYRQSGDAWALAGRCPWAADGTLLAVAIPLYLIQP